MKRIFTLHNYPFIRVSQEQINSSAAAMLPQNVIPSISGSAWGSAVRVLVNGEPLDFGLRRRGAIHFAQQLSISLSSEVGQTIVVCSLFIVLAGFRNPDREGGGNNLGSPSALAAEKTKSENYSAN